MSDEKPGVIMAEGLEHGKITPEGIAAMRARVGVPIPGRDLNYNRVASVDHFRRFAEGYGDDNPLWQSEGYGLASRWSSPIAPPTYPISAGINEAPEPDPIAKERGRGALAGVHSFQAGARWEFYRPIIPGQRIFHERMIVEVEEKESSFTGGTSVVVTHRHLYTATGGDVVAVEYEWFIHAEREAGRLRPKPTASEPRYTDDELDLIDEAVDSHERRGSKSLWFEDVSVGDEIPQLVKGPLRVTDIIAMHVGWGWGPFGIRALELGNRRRRHMPKFFSKNEYGAWDVVQRVHWDGTLAQEIGNPRPYDYGVMRVAWLSQLVTDWMGDDAWLWKLEVENRRFNFIGDVQWCRGRVASTRVDDVRAVVELELWCENQTGEVTTPAKATVVVPSRACGPASLPRVERELEIAGVTMLQRPPVNGGLL